MVSPATDGGSSTRSAAKSGASSDAVLTSRQRVSHRLPPFPPHNEWQRRKWLKATVEANDARIYSLSTRKPRHVIDPRTSKGIAYWDAVTIVALIYTALITPYEVSFLPPASSALDPLFIINRCVDLIFTLDMIVQFRLMYPEDSGTYGGDSQAWVSDPNKIACHYLKTWFLLDFISVFVSLFDIVSVVTQDSGIGSLKALRVIRTLRLFKMLRLVRASHMFKRWEARLEINYSYLTLVQALVVVLLSAHWMACVWTLQATIFSDANMILDSWLGANGYCWQTSEEGETLEYACDPAGQVYVASLYWAVATITSIGYGDISATQRNTAELSVAVVLMLIGAMLWGNTIATFCGVIATLNPSATLFRQQMDELNCFMREQRLSNELRRALREYFHQARRVGNSEPFQRDLITFISPSLLSQVALSGIEKWVRGVWCFSSLSDSFVVQVALALKSLLFAPGEILPPGSKIYIVHRGIALYDARLLTAGHSWGEDILLLNPLNKRNLCGRAMNYLVVWYLNRRDVFRIVEDCPDDKKLLRRKLICLALRRTIVRLAAEQGWQPSLSVSKLFPSSKLTTAFEAAGKPDQRDVLYERLMDVRADVPPEEVSVEVSTRTAAVRRSSGGGLLRSRSQSRSGCSFNLQTSASRAMSARNLEQHSYQRGSPVDSIDLSSIQHSLAELRERHDELQRAQHEGLAAMQEGQSKLLAAMEAIQRNPPAYGNNGGAV